MFNTLKNFLNGEAPQREPIPGTVANSAGGYSFAVADWKQFERFLVIGTTCGTYYIGEQQLTRENLEAVQRCIDADGPRAVGLIKEVSLSGKAPKNDPAIFALALACSSQNDETKQHAFAALNSVCRTFTHLSHFLTFIKQGKLRGFGRGLTRAVARWYNERSVEDLAYQAIKYQSRDGFSQQDAYRLSHPARFVSLTSGSARRALYDYIAKGALALDDEQLGNDEFKPLRRIAAARSLHQENDVVELAKLIREWNLPMEAVPTDRRTALIYEAVLESAGLTWILRNLGNLTMQGVLDSKDNLKFVVKRLTDREQLKKARVHPLAIFQALRTYAGGKGLKGGNTWKALRQIVDALDGAFYASFDYVEPSGKKLLFAVDVSGSMTGALASGMTGVYAFEAAAVMAMAASKVEPDFHLIAFDHSYNRNAGVYELSDVSHKQRLDDVVKRFRSFGGGGTDCSLPFVYAQQEKLRLDGIVCFTDSETWAGRNHPVTALRQYREKMRRPYTKAINVAMAANRFSILPDKDPLCFECLGFDATIPAVISSLMLQ